MRHVQNPQPMLGSVDISQIKFVRKSRDDIDQVLMGLQYIFITPDLKERVFAILRELLPTRASALGTGKADPGKGRPGMDQWQILVLGCLRLSLNTDYDRVHNLANKHITVREMLGVSPWVETTFNLQTIKDNIALFTPEILGRINEEVTKCGHALVKKKGQDLRLSARVDSFVVKTDVHFPTDINLLWDGMRKVIEISAQLCEDNGLTRWRQHEYNTRQLKSAVRTAQKARHSTSKDPIKRAVKVVAMQETHRHLLDKSLSLLDRALSTRAEIARVAQSQVTVAMLCELDQFIGYAQHQIDLIERRVLNGEVIAHEEKIFSLFEPHTEWIVKGKAGVIAELGVRVSVVTSQYGFILHHQVMQKTTDEAVAVSLVEQTQKRYGEMYSVSFDKGYHSPANQDWLKQHVEVPVLPRKGKLNAQDKQRESGREFVDLRHKHSAVESDINALQVHGLDLCRDHGIVGLRRYVALAILARNIQHLGALLLREQAEKERRKRGPYKKAA